jgi:hypothetical protein
LTWDRTEAAEVGSRRLTARDMGRPKWVLKVECVCVKAWNDFSCLKRSSDEILWTRYCFSFEHRIEKQVLVDSFSARNKLKPKRWCFKNEMLRVALNFLKT